MIRTGQTKLPLGKAPALARAVGIDARHLLEMALKEYRPALWDVINEVLLGHGAASGDGRKPAHNGA